MVSGFGALVVNLRSAKWGNTYVSRGIFDLTKAPAGVAAIQHITKTIEERRSKQIITEIPYIAAMSVNKGNRIQNNQLSTTSVSISLLSADGMRSQAVLEALVYASREYAEYFMYTESSGPQRWVLSNSARALGLGPYAHYQDTINAYLRATSRPPLTTVNSYLRASGRGPNSPANSDEIVEGHWLRVNPDDALRRMAANTPELAGMTLEQLSAHADQNPEKYEKLAPVEKYS